MSKITLNTIGSLTQNPTSAQTLINSNNATIQTAMDNTLSRDGTSPNTMLAPLDMNSNQIVNLPTPATTGSPLRLQDLNSFIGGGTITNIPPGGTTGQALAKNSNTDFDLKYENVVTSVGLSLPADFNVTGSPVTGTGTLTASFATTPTGSGAIVRATSPTIVTPSISSVINTGTVNFPAPVTSDTLVGRATTDTLTQKTMSGASNTFSNIALSSLASQAASTYVMNSSTSAGSPTAVAPTSLTSKATPGISDIVMLADQAASSQLKQATFGSLLAGAGVQPGGRITLQTGVPVMTGNTAGATSVFYTPYKSGFVPIYDGTNIVPQPFTELSQTASDTTKSPAATAASSNYDIFVWNDSGTLRATRGPAWSTGTSRGYTLTLTNGVLLNTSSITNGPAALRGTYVGTVRSNGSSTFDWNFGGAASGGTAALLNVWNYYNRVRTAATVTDSGATYTYASSTIRQARASTGNQINLVVGIQEEAASVFLLTEVSLAATASTFAAAGIGLDTTTAYSFGRAIGFNNAAVAQAFTISQGGVWMTPIGVHFVSSNESSSGATHTYDDNSTNYLTFEMMM